jgi:hypothetical protein
VHRLLEAAGGSMAASALGVFLEREAPDVRPKKRFVATIAALPGVFLNPDQGEAAFSLL